MPRHTPVVPAFRTLTQSGGALQHAVQKEKHALPAYWHSPSRKQGHSGRQVLAIFIRAHCHGLWQPSTTLWTTLPGIMLDTPLKKPAQKKKKALHCIEELITHRRLAISRSHLAYQPDDLPALQFALVGRTGVCKCARAAESNPQHTNKQSLRHGHSPVSSQSPKKACCAVSCTSSALKSHADLQK